MLTRDKNVYYLQVLYHTKLMRKLRDLKLAFDGFK